MTTPESLARTQTAGLRRLLGVLTERSHFYQRKGITPDQASQFTLNRLPELPLTTKGELVEDQRVHPPYGSGLTEPLDHYVRVHRTSGTTGSPLRWLDTQSSWTAFLDCWERVFTAAGITNKDRIFVAFSFGPFIGFWGAFEAAHRMGALAVSGGAQSTRQRLRAMLDEGATVLVSTPTYAQHLAEVAHSESLDIANSKVEKLIQAGEPGASVPNIYKKLASAWNAEIYDHAGATEVGAWGFPATFRGARFGEMCINDENFIAEVIDPETGLYPKASAENTLTGELVLTSFARLGSPLLRYRTGDLVRLISPDRGCPFHRLDGGVLGRVDDMFLVRGVNVFPSAIENVVLGIQGVAEFQARVIQRDGLTELELEVEAIDNTIDSRRLAETVSQRLRDELSLRVEVQLAKECLPRFELKARRFQFETR